jgi:outer membrane receptor protein involved in Fe transport
MRKAGLTRFLLATCASVALASGAQAQDATPLESGVAAPEADPPRVDTPAAVTNSASGEIVVTGSRLQASGFQAPTPVTVLGTALLNQRAPSTIADVVNEIPAFRQTVTNTQSQRANGNGGQNQVDLRGLGVVRTLVLVNGRRHVPSNNNGSIDVNLIPTPLVDRVEVVTGGASAAYGSDAVSGVVNFILNDRLEGIRGTAQYGISEYGDNIEPTLSLGGGFSFGDGRGHFVAGGDFSDNKGVGTIYSRKWGRKQAGLVSFGSAATRGDLPAQGLLNDVTYSTQADGSVINSGPLRGIRFGENGTTSPFQYGTVYGNLMVGGSNPPDANPFGNWNLRVPVRRYTGMASLNYEFSDAFTAFAEFGYGNVRSEGFTTYHQAASLIVPIGNPFIPASVRAAMVANNLSSISVGRYETQLGGYLLDSRTETKRGTIGFKGKIAENWSWDAYATHGVSDGDQILKTNIFEGNYLAATYVVAGPNGTPVCGPLGTNPNLTPARAAQVQPGCVPFNIFGRESPSDAALDYVRYRSQNETRYEQNVYAANLNGEPFSTWAGPVSLALGIEHRREEASSSADPFGRQNVGLANNGSTYEGSVKITEGYAEVGVPLAKDMAFARALDLNGAIRRTHYSSSGSVTTWKLGATWEPVEAIRLRVTRSRDIRAANIGELFSQRSATFTASFLNPINNRTGPVNVVSGGNPNLKPEVARNWTAGIVLQPTWEWARGFRASVDYFDVDIKGVIATVAATDIALRCAQGLTEYCSLITFDNSPAGISDIQTVPANLNRLKTSGFDVEVAYRVPLDAIGVPGQLDLRSLTTITRHLTRSDAATSIDRAGSGALGGVPSWSNNTTVSYALGAVTNTFQFRYTPSLKADATLIGPDDDNFDPKLPNSINVNRFPASMYVNYTLQFDVKTSKGNSMQLFTVVNNLLNKTPPDYSLIAFVAGGNPYELIGRSYKVGARFKL